MAGPPGPHDRTRGPWRGRVVFGSKTSRDGADHTETARKAQREAADAVEATVPSPPNVWEIVGGSTVEFFQDDGGLWLADHVSRSRGSVGLLAKEALRADAERLAVQWLRANGLRRVPSEVRESEP